MFIQKIKNNKSVYTVHSPLGETNISKCNALIGGHADYSGSTKVGSSNLGRVREGFSGEVAFKSGLET